MLIINGQDSVGAKFEALQPVIRNQKAAVLETNQRFFDALASSDVDTMRSVWIDSNDAHVSQRIFIW